MNGSVPKAWYGGISQSMRVTLLRLWSVYLYDIECRSADRKQYKQDSISDQEGEGKRLGVSDSLGKIIWSSCWW